VGQAADVVGQARNTKRAWDRMVATEPGSGAAGPKGTGNNSVGSKPGNGKLADIRGTGRPVPRVDPRNKPEPEPSRGGRGGGGGRVGTSVGRPSVSGSSVSSGSPSTTPASKAPSESSTASKSTPGDSSTDSWSINFLRSKRGLPSLSKADKPSMPSGDSKVGPLSGNFGKDTGYERKLSIPSSGENGYDIAKMSTPKFDTKTDLLKKRKG
jgi:hypothetical protein